MEEFGAGGLAFEDAFGFGRAPGHGAHAAEGDADLREAAVGGLSDDCGGGQGELVGGAVAELEVVRLGAGGGGRSVTEVMRSPGWSTVSMLGVLPGRR